MIRLDVEPPKKLSDAIKLALADLELVEKNRDKYKVDMSVWHTGRKNYSNRCSVCFAGAVMSQTLNADIELSLGYEDFPYKWQGIFSALDNIRTGHLYFAIDDFYGCPDSGEGLEIVGKMQAKYPEEVPVIPYDEDPSVFKQQMLEIANMLAEHGD